MTATTIPSNGAQRKTLASQLDRLDGILDALSDGLNQAVTTAVQDAVSQAVREGVQQAVQTLVSELLANPDALAILRATLTPPDLAPPPPPSQPEPGRPEGLASRLLGRAAQACQAAREGARRAASAVREGLRVARPYRKPLLIAAGVGTAVAVGACLAGPWVAGPAAWLGGFVSTLAVRAGAALRRTFGLAPAAAPA